MKKIYSLKRNEEIAKIVHNKKFFKNEIFVVYYQPSNLEFSRICYSVSKKIGIAVIRNKCKRQVREMATKIFDFSKPIDYVIVVRSAFLENDFAFNFKKLESLYLKINSNK